MMSAEEFCEKVGEGNNAGGWEDLEQYNRVKTLMVEFAKMQVEAAKKEIADKAIDDNMVDNCSDHTPYWGNCQSCGRSDNFKRLTTDTEAIKESILNAYPLENIK